MKNLLKWVVGVAILAATQLAVAADPVAEGTSYGKFLCTDCPTAPPMGPLEARAFVGVFVNPFVTRWQSYQTFTVCDGTTCIKYITTDIGKTFVPFKKFSDDGKGYKATGSLVAALEPLPTDPVTGGGSGGGSAGTTIPGGPGSGNGSSGSDPTCCVSGGEPVIVGSGGSGTGGFGLPPKKDPPKTSTEP